jgi:hypothetical protein
MRGRLQEECVRGRLQEECVRGRARVVGFGVMRAKEACLELREVVLWLDGRNNSGRPREEMRGRARVVGLGVMRATEAWLELRESCFG